MTSEKSNEIIGCLIIALSVLICVLFVEYRALCNHTNRLIVLQNQYKVYLDAMRTVMRKYGDDGKKEWCARRSFPLDAQVVSSNDNSSACLFLNRKEQYLKESTLSYFKEQQLDGLLGRLQADYWSNDVVIESVKSKQSAPKAATISAPPAQQYAHGRLDLALSWPIKRSQFWLSSLFGSRRNPDGSWGFHRGIDMASPRGTHVKAAAPGKVIESRYVPGYGNTVVVQHSPKYKTRYAHLDCINVVEGQQVHREALLGKVGDTGLVRKAGTDASHLHFEVCAFNKQINPLPFLQQRA